MVPFQRPTTPIADPDGAEVGIRRAMFYCAWDVSKDSLESNKLSVHVSILLLYTRSRILSQSFSAQLGTQEGSAPTALGWDDFGWEEVEADSGWEEVGAAQTQLPHSENGAQLYGSLGWQFPLSSGGMLHLSSTHAQTERMACWTAYARLIRRVCGLSDVVPF